MKRYKLFIGSNGKWHNKRGEYSLYAMEDNKDDLIELQCLLGVESFIWDSLKHKVIDKNLYRTH